MSSQLPSGVEPGTGTQIHYEAQADPEHIDRRTDPRAYEEEIRWHGCGRTWKCGQEYIDTVHWDVCTLVEVIRKSSWCDAGKPSEGNLRLVFHYDRLDVGNSLGRYEYDPNLALSDDHRDDPVQRYKPRYTR